MMFQRISAVVVVLSFTVALGVGIDTTAGENPKDPFDQLVKEIDHPQDKYEYMLENLIKNPRLDAVAVGQNPDKPVQAPKPQKPMAKEERWNKWYWMTGRNKLLLTYIIAASICAGLLFGAYQSRGFVTVASILIYVAALSSMSLLIRNVYVNAQFEYPMFLTAMHFVATALVGTSILVYRCWQKGENFIGWLKTNSPDSNVFLKRLVPVAIVFALSLGLANNGLLLTNAHFYEMVCSSAPLVTAAIAVTVGKNFDVRLMPSLALITLSMFVIAFGEAKLSVLGLVACVGGVVGRAAKSTLQYSLMGGSEWQRMDPVEVAVWTSMTCSVLMLPWALFTEGRAPFTQIHQQEAFNAVLYTCICASILNIAALFVLRELDPVGQLIVGQTKGLLAILGAVASFGELVTMQQLIGYSVLLCGIFLYNRVDMAIKTEKSSKFPNEADEFKKIQKV
jgi:drug/metabolite transporter (DMT)-like permease